MLLIPGMVAAKRNPARQIVYGSGLYSLHAHGENKARNGSLNPQNQKVEQYITNGGNTFSAARRGTENPPCVLVSLAVNVLQK